MRLNLDDLIGALQIGLLIAREWRKGGNADIEIDPEKIRALRIPEETIERWKALRRTGEDENE